MAALQERFTRVQAGEPQCVVIVGEAGIGKTRLAEELCTQAVLAGARVKRVVTQPHDVHRPMATFADLVPELLQLPGALGCSPETMASLKRLVKTDCFEQGPAVNEANSEIIASAIARAIADLVDAISAEAPLLLLVDDVQWIDERSRQTLVTIAASRRSLRLMVALTSRDAGVARALCRQSERVFRLGLSSLAPDSARELTNRALIQLVATDRELRDWIVSTSGGNPFFLKCLIGHYQSTGERFVVPTTLSELLHQRVAGLSSRAAALLAACVALARHSDVDRVLRVLEMPQIELQLAAAELESLHLITQTGSRLEPSHSLVAEAIERLTPPVSFRLLHRRVALVLLSEDETSISPARLWDCAEHWLVAGEPKCAADVIQRCASAALEIGRPREAAELLLRAAALLGREQAIPLIRQAAEIADGAHEVDLVKRAVGRLRQLEVQVEGDPVELAELHAHLADWDYPPLIIGRLRSWIASNGPVEHRVRAAIALLILAEVDGLPEIGSFVYDALIRDVEPANQNSDGSTLTVMLIYHCIFGEIETARSIVELLLDSARGLPSSKAVDTFRKCGVALWRLGLAERAYPLFERWYEHARAEGLLRMQFDAAVALFGTHIDVNADAAEKWGRLADSMISDDPDLESSPTYMILRLDDACRIGDATEAQKWFDRALQLRGSNSRSRSSRWLEAAELRIRQLRGDLPSITEAKRLVEQHKSNWEIGDVADFEMGVCLWLLYEHDAFEDALSAAEKYFCENRRTKNVPSRIVREAAAALCARQAERDGRLRFTALHAAASFEPWGRLARSPGEISLST
jgi:tetratricopeptide (TPR) repeat protein